jgi:hypothetical protein
MPKWVVPTIKLLGPFFIFNFILFLVQSRAASPQIEGGQYVLISHGQIVKALTPVEYFKLKAAELRMYWWFPRGRQASRLPATQGTAGSGRDTG